MKTIFMLLFLFVFLGCAQRPDAPTIVSRRDDRVSLKGRGVVLLPLDKRVSIAQDLLEEREGVWNDTQKRAQEAKNRAVSVLKKGGFSFTHSLTLHGNLVSKENQARVSFYRPEEVARLVLSLGLFAQQRKRQHLSHTVCPTLLKRMASRAPLSLYVGASFSMRDEAFVERRSGKEVFMSALAEALAQAFAEALTQGISAGISAAASSAGGSRRRRSRRSRRRYSRRTSRRRYAFSRKGKSRRRYRSNGHHRRRQRRRYGQNATLVTTSPHRLGPYASSTDHQAGFHERSFRKVSKWKSSGRELQISVSHLFQGGGISILFPPIVLCPISPQRPLRIPIHISE